MEIFKHKIAIVGNAPTEFGTGNGKLIDSFDKVIRFNNFELGPKHSADYGERTDYWCHCAWNGIKMRDQKFEKVLISTPLCLSDSKQPSHIDEKVLNKYKDVNMAIPQECYNELCVLMRKLAPRILTSPSSGLTIAYWTYKENNNTLNRNCLFGFNHFDTSLGYIDYFDKDNSLYVNQQKPAVPHNGYVQKVVFDYLCGDS